jgi:hypothetical protein
MRPPVSTTGLGVRASVAGPESHVACIASREPLAIWR